MPESSKLSSLPNIGKDTEQKLIYVGITSPDEFRSTGTEQAFLRLQSVDPGACIQLLYGLEGAIQGISSSKLSEARKKELKEFHRMSQISRK